MVRLRRQIGIIVEQFWFLTLGGLLAYWLNWAIIPLVMPASVLQTVFFALVGLGFVLLLFIVYLFQMYKEFSNYVKGRMIFLGASFVSLMLASFAFFGVIVMIYTPNTEMSTMIFANIFKSILLASLFSFFERLLRSWKTKKKEKEDMFNSRVLARGFGDKTLPPSFLPKHRQLARLKRTQLQARAR